MNSLAFSIYTAFFALNSCSHFSLYSYAFSFDISSFFELSSNFDTHIFKDYNSHRLKQLSAQNI